MKTRALYTQRALPAYRGRIARPAGGSIGAQRLRRKRNAFLPFLTILATFVLLASPLLAGLAAAEGDTPPSRVATSRDTETVSGWLSAVWPDGQAKGSAHGPIYAVMSSDGTITYVQMDDPAVQDLLAASGGILALDRKHVTISGKHLAVGPSGHGALKAESVHVTTVPSTSGPQPLAALPDAVTGSQPWISILCRFADVTATPASLPYFQTMLDNTKPHLDHYWREASYNQANIAGSTALGWYTLPKRGRHM